MDRHDRGGMTAIALERLERAYNEPATDVCKQNRQTIEERFLRYKDKWLLMLTSVDDEIYCKVMAAEGIENTRDINYLEEIGLQLIREMPLKATETILMCHKIQRYDWYSGADKEDYVTVDMVLDAIEGGRWHYKPYWQQRKKEEQAAFKEAIAIAEREGDKDKVQRLQGRCKWVIEDMDDHIRGSVDDIALARRLDIGEILIGVYNRNYDEPTKQEEIMLETISNLNKPQTYSILNNKVANQYHTIQDLLLNTEPNGQLTFLQDTIPVELASAAMKKKGVSVTTLVGLTYTGELSKKLARLNGYDKAILNTVCSIWQAGNKTMTLSDIHRVLNGGADKKPKKAQTDKILQSLKKLSGTRIYLDVTEEINRGFLTINDSRVVGGIIDRALLEYTGGMFQTENGQEVYAISLMAEPILYTYSKSKAHGAQLVSFDVKLLDTKSVSSTDDIVAIKEYLLQQITLMKNNQRDNNIIRYSSIYESSGIPEPDKVKAKRYRESISKLLEEWKAADYIKGYSEKKEGKSITGVAIRY